MMINPQLERNKENFLVSIQFCVSFIQNQTITYFKHTLNVIPQQNNNTKPIKSVSIYATSAKLQRRVDITARAQITCCFFVCLSGLNVCLRYAIKLKFPLNAFPAALTTHSLIMTPLSFILACSFEMNCYLHKTQSENLLSRHNGFMAGNF